MSKKTKVKNATKATKGKLKEAVGEAVGDESLEAEGKRDRVVGNLAQAGEKVKDAFKE
jgi:uncharacterized protein YjbJ (UPF0337 family)